jgi:hypothetical protein
MEGQTSVAGFAVTGSLGFHLKEGFNGLTGLDPGVHNATASCFPGSRGEHMRDVAELETGVMQGQAPGLERQA